ncbi:MAG: mechanosensitive ion channel family protein [Calditrichaeota bacterium]|nr:mechanosensitive ion channel family protein [Calditrichota bacterium]
MQKLFDWVYAKTGVTQLFQERLLESLLIIGVLVLIRFLTLNFVYREIEDTRKRYRWRKSVTYVLTLIGLFIVGRIWFQGFQSIATFFGIFAAGIAIALQDLLVNIAGWLFIMWRKPFDVGDRIEVNEHAGDVIDRRLFMFTIMEIGNWVGAEQSTGRVVHLPNGWVFKYSLANYSRGFSYIWNEIPVLLTFESDWKKAKKILLDIANEHAESLSQSAEKRIKAAAKRYMIFYSKLTPIVWTSVKDSGVLLTIRYLCDPRKRRSSEHAIWETILEVFAKINDIDFAYSTIRIFNNPQEGKPGAGTAKK